MLAALTSLTDELPPVPVPLPITVSEIEGVEPPGVEPPVLVLLLVTAPPAPP